MREHLASYDFARACDRMTAMAIHITGAADRLLTDDPVALRAGTMLDQRTR